jgi:hypothetical protein
MKKFSIKNLFFKLFFVVVLVTTLVACKSASVVLPKIVETTKTITIKEVLHDTVFETKKDSSFYKAFLECQDGKVVASPTPPKEGLKAGKYLKVPKVIIKDNYITVSCEAEAQKIFAKWKENYITNNQATTITKTVAVALPLTFWQKFQIYAGRILLFIIIGLAGISLYSKYKNII